MIGTNASYWLFSSYVDRFLDVTLPFVCLFLALAWCLIFAKRLMRTCEIVGLGVFGVYHLFRVYALTTELEQGILILNVYVFWSTIYYFYIFMVLERKRALAFSFFIFCVTILMGIPHFHDSRAYDALTQYYISTFVYILVLFYLQRVLSAFLETDMLKKLAYCDALTNIGNRRSIDEWLDVEINQHQNSRQVFSVILFDIDHFKQINDEFGHDVGDHVLMEIASLVKNYVPPDSLFGRWGGEEFIIILKNQNLLEATQFAEKLRGLIKSHSFRYVKHVTSSFGVATLQPNDVPKTLIKRADQALYMAKKNGRNKVQNL